MGVYPFERKDAVESFDLAVGLRPVGAGVFVDDVTEDGVEQLVMPQDITSTELSATEDHQKS